MITFKNGKKLEFVGRKVSYERGKPIDKEAANDAFKKCKKEILDVFFVENGFYKWKTTQYVRLDAAGLLEYVELQKSRFDYTGFYVNFRVVPLWLPMKHLETDVGVGERLHNGYQDWCYANYEVAKVNFEDIREGARTCLLPWFEEFCDEENFREMLLENKGWPSWPGIRERWCRALKQSEEEKKAIILENIEKFKLPKKLAQGL